MKACTKCGETNPAEQFSWRNKAKGTKYHWCKACQKVYDKARNSTSKRKQQRKQRQQEIRNRNRTFVYEYLSKNPCIDCGEARIPCLQFDHKDGVEKLVCISNMMDYKQSTIMEEIAKCVVRCANCHAIRTAKSQGWYAGAEVS